MDSPIDRQLLEYVQRVARTGTKRIVIPARLFVGASKEAMRDVKDYARAIGATIEAG